MEDGAQNSSLTGPQSSSADKNRAGSDHPDPQPMNLLLLEDDEVDALALDRALKAGTIAYKLKRARDGVEAMELLKSGAVVQPCIIVADINMPRMNGLEFVRMLRSDPELAHTIVFVLSSSDHERDISRAYAQNVAGYFVKKSSSDTLDQFARLLSVYWGIVELPKNEGSGKRP